MLWIFVINHNNYSHSTKFENGISFPFFLNMGEIHCDFEIEPVNYLLEDIPCFDMRTEKGRQDLEDLESPTDFIFIIPEVRLKNSRITHPTATSE